MKNLFRSLTMGTCIVSVALLTGCGGSDSNSSLGVQARSVDMPEGLTLALINANDGAYRAFNTETEQLTDLNEAAKASGDAGVQKLEITDTSTLGQILHWPDYREVDGKEVFDNKYLLMRPQYNSGDSIDSSSFVQLVHFHGTTLAAHSADEFANPEAGSSKAAALARLNAFVAEQKELREELTTALQSEAQTLCRGFIDPVLAFEHEEQENHGAATANADNEEHEHGDLMHYALTDAGRVYFYKEGDSGLVKTQGFVKLDNISSISDCSKTTIARINEDGVLIFVPDTQMFYMIDSHGGDFHQHSTWAVNKILPAGTSVDMVAVLGEGEGHDHDHDHK